MDDPLIIALAVSGVGMLVLFLALAFLYGLMYLMSTYIKDRPEAEDQKAQHVSREAQSQEQGARDKKLRAAAIAVALARAELDMSPVGASRAEEKAGVSAWRAFHHQRQLTHNVPTRRAR